MSAKADNRTSKDLHFQCRVLTQEVYYINKFLSLPKGSIIHMGINRVNIVLAGSYGDGRNVPAEDFLPSTNFEFMGKLVSIVAQAGGASAYIDFASLYLEEFMKEDEPYELFHQRLASIQENLCYWLDQQSLSAFKTMSERGLNIRLFLDLDIDDNQIELTLAADLLRACGRLNVKIDMNSY